MMTDKQNVEDCSMDELDCSSDSKILSLPIKLNAEIIGDNKSETDLKTPGYWINSDNVDFNRKRDNIFSGLVQFDSDHKEEIIKLKQFTCPINEEPEEAEILEESEEETESEKKFKIPVGIPARNKRKLEPDYIQHPDRWTKYSLEDVTDEELSDQSNTKAALNFLEERRLLKNIEPAAETNLDLPVKYESFTFKKPEKELSIDEEKEDEDKTEFCMTGKKMRISSKTLLNSEMKHQVSLDYLNELQKIIETEVVETNEKIELIPKDDKEGKSLISEEEIVKFNKSGKKFNRKNLRDRNNVIDN